MRASDRDLIRGGQYGLRPRVPHEQAEHMAAPTKAANVKKVLANVWRGICRAKSQKFGLKSQDRTGPVVLNSNHNNKNNL